MLDSGSLLWSAVVIRFPLRPVIFCDRDTVCFEAVAGHDLKKGVLLPPMKGRVRWVGFL